MVHSWQPLRLRDYWLHHLCNKPQTCPQCGGQHTVKNGHTHSGKQRYKCQTCQRQFVHKPRQKLVSQATRDLIDKLLLERVALAGIARVTGVSESWLQNYVNLKYSRVPRVVQVSAKPRGKLTIECDEMWSFVQHKKNKVWIWLALDVSTREIVGVYVGKRDKNAAKKLWRSLPPVYRQCAVAYTDFWNAYQGVIPTKRHKPVGKESGKTNHIERLNGTIRQRVSRLVRKALSFSKKMENHVGAVWYFVHHYNASLPA